MTSFFFQNLNLQSKCFCFDIFYALKLCLAFFLLSRLSLSPQSARLELEKLPRGLRTDFLEKDVERDRMEKEVMRRSEELRRGPEYKTNSTLNHFICFCIIVCNYFVKICKSVVAIAGQGLYSWNNELALKLC